MLDVLFRVVVMVVVVIKLLDDIVALRFIIVKLVDIFEITVELSWINDEFTVIVVFP